MKSSMKREKILVIALFVLLALPEAGPYQAVIPDVFYARYEGTITVGKKVLDIVMNLHKCDDAADGYYYYKGRGILISIKGGFDRSGKVNLSEYTDAKLTGFFDGQFTSDSTIEGVWNTPSSAGNAAFKLTETYPSGSVKAEMKRLHKETVVYKNRASVTLEYPVISGVESQLTLRRIRGLINNGISPEAALEQNVNSLVNDMKNTYTENEKAPSDWYYLEQVSVAFNDNNILGIQSHLEEYSGGAHPNHSVAYTNINTASGTLISLSDLLMSGYEAELNRVAEELFKKTYYIGEGRMYKTYDDAGFWLEPGKFSVPENFLITPGGLLFLFNPYEIAPYAAGAIEFFVPYLKIKNLIQAGSIIEKFIYY
jgi:hypothetical protein